MDLVKEAIFLGFSGAAVMDTKELVFVPEYRTFCEENLCGCYNVNPACPPESGTAEEMKQLIDDVDSPALKVCIDTGAMVRAKDTIDDYFKIFGDRIVHAHFVDVDEDHFTTHLAWGDGTRNMKEELEAFRRNGYKGILSVECVNGRYFENPKVADKQSMKNFLKFK